jgi:hypothetical protein
MAITAAICNSFKQEILEGIHSSGDTYKLALYTSAATLSKATTAYTTSGEVASGGGYTTGGVALTGFSVTIDTDTAILDFTTDLVWPSATITARGALIYNSSKSNKAVAVLDFGADISSTNGNFTITFPVPTAATGLIRIA